LSVIRFFVLAVALIAGCAAAAEGEGPSRPGAAAIRPALADPLHAAATDATLIARAANGAAWRAFLSGDGSARRMADGADGAWHVDDSGRLCISFPDQRNCWWVLRDGSSEPALRGERGERARLARGSTEL
jgi:hypothetical protein